MACKKCENIKEIENDDVPHVIRHCDECGRAMKVIETDKHGKGIKIRKGDQFIIPRGWLKISANPLQSTGYMTRKGLELYAKSRFLEDISKNCDDINKILDHNESITDRVLSKSELLKGLDLNNTEHEEQILKILEEHEGSVEWWASISGVFNEIAKKAIAEGDATKVAWAVTCSERFRSMLIFKRDFEEVIWMGQSAKRIVELLKLWDTNKDNADENFWQNTFNEHSYVLSQVFSVPVVFIQDKAYVGGMKIDRNDAKFVDYLFSGDVSGEAYIIEIKTPKTPLIGSRYRKGVYKPSSEISGAIVQTLDYRISLTQNLSTIANNFPKKLSAFNPKCLIVAGHGEVELSDDKKRRSFELFRSSLNGVDIVTYDELFKKMEVLASLFNLIKKKS